MLKFTALAMLTLVMHLPLVLCVVHCNITSVVRYRSVYFTVLISPLSLASLQISVHEIGSQGIFQ